jgi:hypothetical protein
VQTRQRALGDDDEVWGDLAALDDARLARYSRSGIYNTIAETAVLERARRYLAKCDPAISGQRGRAKLWATACGICHGFGLSAEETFGLLRAWNLSNQPPFAEGELQATCWRAHRKPAPRGDKLR